MPESGKLTVGAKVEKSDGIMAPMLLPDTADRSPVGPLEPSKK